MRKAVRFLLTSLLPFAVLIAYSVLSSIYPLCLCGKHNILPQLILLAAGNALVGFTILLICNKAGKETGKKRIPYDFIAGISVLVITILCFVPAPKSSLFSTVFNSDMIVLFLGIYIGLFAIIFCRLFKMLKQQKYKKNVQPPQ